MFSGFFFQDENPPIPDSISPDITDFLRQCFKKVIVVYIDKCSSLAGD